MWGPAISGMGKSAYLRKPKLQAYPPIFSLTPKASGSTWLQSCEDIIHGGVVDSEETTEDADKEDAADTDEASDDTKDAETTEEPEETEAAEDAE